VRLHDRTLRDRSCARPSVLNIVDGFSNSLRPAFLALLADIHADPHAGDPEDEQRKIS
jgi:hypothetical protein